MFDWWTDITLFHRFYWVVAIIATTLFIMMFILSMLGSDADVDIDVDIDMDLDAPDGLIDFSYISIKSVLAFFTMFGWSGVILISNDLSKSWVIGLSMIFGLAALFMVGYMTVFLHGLSESGNLDKSKLMNKTAKVYLTIPKENDKLGKIHVIVDGSLKEYDARAEEDAIMNGEMVRIVALEKDNVMLVERV